MFYHYYTYVYREQILLPMNFEYVLLILITLAFLGVRYLVVTLYVCFQTITYPDLALFEDSLFVF